MCLPANMQFELARALAVPLAFELPVEVPQLVLEISAMGCRGTMSSQAGRCDRRGLGRTPGTSARRRRVRRDGGHIGHDLLLEQAETKIQTKKLMQKSNIQQFLSKMKANATRNQNIICMMTTLKSFLEFVVHKKQISILN